MHAQIDNVITIFDRRPFIPADIAGEDFEASRLGEGNLETYADLIADQARAAADLIAPALGAAKQTECELDRMVRSSRDEAAETLSAFKDAAESARAMLDILDRAANRLAATIYASALRPVGDA